MKKVRAITLSLGVLLLTAAVSAQTSGRAAGAAKTGGCAGCAQNAGLASQPAEVVSSRPVPGSNENMLVGRIENLIPIGVLAVLGCEKCTEEAVSWALEQGSSFEDVGRALRTVAAMQKLDCFNQTFGPDVAGRMEKPLEAGRRALEQAMTRAGK
jgi:hypothetical protein